MKGRAAVGYTVAVSFDNDVRSVGDVAVTLAPIVVYSNKICRACDDHLRAGVPLGLAIVACFSCAPHFLKLKRDRK